jgi:hypothetical protein
MAWESIAPRYEPYQDSRLDYLGDYPHLLVVRCTMIAEAIERSWK